MTPFMGQNEAERTRLFIMDKSIQAQSNLNLLSFLSREKPGSFACLQLQQGKAKIIS